MWRTDIEKECFIHYNSLDSLGLRKYLTGINTNDPVSDTFAENRHHVLRAA